MNIPVVHAVKPSMHYDPSESQMKNLPAQVVKALTPGGCYPLSSPTQQGVTIQTILLVEVDVVDAAAEIAALVRIEIHY